MSEAEDIIKRYEKRKQLPPDRYCYLNAATYMSEQEKERAILRLIRKTQLEPLSNKKLLEIGCGTGINLLNFIKMGFQPENLFANDILSERITFAKNILPSKVTFYEGDANQLDFENGRFDFVFQSMVFSSILDDEFRHNLAEKMWRWTKVGGGILWYDFTFNNPFNKDVKKVSFKEVKNLFPSSDIISYKITLAPPLSRILSKYHYRLYDVFNSLYFLRTHLLCFIRKNS